jgi:voltage-gated potassium channel
MSTRGEHIFQRRRRSPRRSHFASLSLTGALLALIALSLEQTHSGLGIVMVCAILSLVIAFHTLFGASRFFVLALANLIGVYACIFLFFAEANFQLVDTPVLWVGFLAPLAAFFAGSLWRRRAIHRLVFRDHPRDVHGIGQIVAWLLPLMAIAVASFLVPEQGVGKFAIDGLFLAAMGTTAGIVMFVSRDVAVFLFDTAQLFEEFFERVAMRLAPAFAFLTFYSLAVIAFAAVYSLIDGASVYRQFHIDGVLRRITFPESLYFSLTTLSTVGNGDITPATNLTRLLVGLEVVCGILLLLFGFNEIISYSRERQQQ